MRTTILLPILGAALSSALDIGIDLPQNAELDILDIPQTKVYVSSLLSQYASYTAYVAPPQATVQVHFQPAKVTPPASCASFWLENIKHQGKAAFNSNSSYAVFRNVKDYGAKGT